MVSLTIDGKKIEVPLGTSVLQAARMSDIFIPTLCEHPRLSLYSGCRLCFVEIDGFRTLQPSCTMPVAPNMVIRTDNDRIRAARKFILTMIFSERNHFCPFCVVSGGDCELQNEAYKLDMTHWPLAPNWKKYPVDATQKYYVMDHNRCILCRRCVRACAEMSGNFTLAFEERGANSLLIADIGVPLGDSSCVSCGSCVQVCPTGAIIDRVSAYRGRETQLERHKTLCIGCSVGCGVDVLTRDNHLVRIESNWDAPVNRGVLCKLGRFIPLEEDRQRLVTPMVRKNGSLQVATWDEALDLVASKLKPLIGKKDKGIAALVSTRLPAETLYLFKKIFADGAQSDLVTSIEEGQPTALPANLAEEMQKPFEGSLDVIHQADCVVLIGTNLVDNHEVAGFFVKRSLPNGVKLVVIDPNDNPMDNLADLVLKPAKGNDIELLQGISATILKQGHAKGKSALNSEKCIEAARKVGISVDKLVEAGNLIGSALKPVFIYGKGVTTQNSSSVLKALLELAEITGALTKDYSAVIGTKGEANSMAAVQYKLDKPFILNGHQAVCLTLGDHNTSPRLLERLTKVPFLVVQASYASQITAQADVILPVETWSEQEGHYVNLDGRLQKAIKSLRAPEDVLSNETVLKSLASRLGLKVDNKWKEQLLERIPTVAIVES